MLLIADLTTWITPLWLLSIGVASAVLLLAAVYGLLWIAKRPAAIEIGGRIKESLMMPVVYLAGLLVVFSLIALPVVPYRSLLAAVGRISSVGTQEVTITVPAATPQFSMEVPVRGSELQSYVMTSDQPVTVNVRTIGGR